MGFLTNAKIFSLENVCPPLRNEILWCPWTKRGDLSPITPCINAGMGLAQCPTSHKGAESRDVGTCFPWRCVLSSCWGLSCRKKPSFRSNQRSCINLLRLRSWSWKGQRKGSLGVPSWGKDRIQPPPLDKGKLSRNQGYESNVSS